jgi:lysozyme
VATDQPVLREFFDRLLPILEQFEGFRPRPYLCPAGVPTIGVGSTRYLDGRPVALTDPPITREHARVLAREQILADYLPAVLRLCTNLQTLDRAAAITDFAYNLGTGALRASTLRRRINEDRWPEVPAELRKWVRGGGRVLPGLVRRREAEIRLLGR